ncbi:MAG: TorD/DmsD family molecular chaperone [Planctomycetota bacterium]|jgi:TorA maturation chaperone TorD
MKNQGQKNTTSMSETADERHKQAVSRSNCYGLLALVFRDAPTAETIAQLTNRPLAEVLSRLGYDIAKDLAGELDVVTRRLGEQYTRTFVGPGPHVSPYASVHHSGEGQLWGDSTVWVKRFIETTGLSFRNNWDSIPDHIAIELELMQRLAAHEAQLWVPNPSGPSHNEKNVDKQLCQCLQAQEQFLREHLCIWAPKFCERILETSTSLFYREMAKLMKSFVLSDAEQIAEALSGTAHLSVAGNVTVRHSGIQARELD